MSRYKPDYIIYKVKIKFRNRVLANLPSSFEPLPFIAKRQLMDEGVEVTEETLRERIEELEGEIGAEQVVTKLIFPSDSTGLYIKERNVKGHLKEVGKVLKIRGVRDAVNHGLHVQPDKIYFMRGNEVLKRPDGECQTGIRVLTVRGPRSCLKIADYLHQPEIEFYLHVVPSVARTVLTEENIKKMFMYGQDHGFLGDRSLGEGKYELVSLSKLK